MSLSVVSPDAVGKTGSVSTIAIKAKATSIQAVSYGTASPTITSGKSFQITILAGEVPLIVTLSSPGPFPDQVIMLDTSATPPVQLDMFINKAILTVWSPTIQGT